MAGTSDIAFITAISTAFAINLNLPTSVYHKLFNVDTTKGINTSIEVIITEKQHLYIEKNVYT